MKRLSSVLGQYETGRRGGDLVYWCPGCKHAHSINVRQGTEHPSWTWDGSVDQPTFIPSVRHFYTRYGDDEKPIGEVTLCHYFVVKGEIQYQGDCQHALNGKTVALPPLPSDDDYNFGE